MPVVDRAAERPASPPYGPSGNTALLGANLPYEIWCVLPGVPRR